MLPEHQQELVHAKASTATKFIPEVKENETDNATSKSIEIASVIDKSKSDEIDYATVTA